MKLQNTYPFDFEPKITQELLNQYCELILNDVIEDYCLKERGKTFNFQGNRLGDRSFFILTYAFDLIQITSLVKMTNCPHFSFISNYVSQRLFLMAWKGQSVEGKTLGNIAKGLQYELTNLNEIIKDNDDDSISKSS